MATYQESGMFFDEKRSLGMVDREIEEGMDARTGLLTLIDTLTNILGNLDMKLQMEEARVRRELKA